MHPSSTYVHPVAYILQQPAFITTFCLLAPACHTYPECLAWHVYSISTTFFTVAKLISAGSLVMFRSLRLASGLMNLVMAVSLPNHDLLPQASKSVSEQRPDNSLKASNISMSASLPALLVVPFWYSSVGILTICCALLQYVYKRIHYRAL